MTSSSSSESEISVQIKKSYKPKRDSSEPNKSKLDPDPVFYREVDMYDMPSQYTEDIETFSLNLADPRESILVSSITVWGLNYVASQQELRPKGPSAMFPVSPTLKEASDKFEQYFQTAKLPEGKFIKPLPPLPRLGEPCFEDLLQELNIDFCKNLYPP